MRKSISVLGRRQFSTENAYSVSASIFSRAQVSIVMRADCVPDRCPAIRGRCRFCAQRPFPSIITATCLGSRVKSSFSSRFAYSGVTGPSEPGVATCSDLGVWLCGTVLCRPSRESSLRRKVNTRSGGCATSGLRPLSMWRRHALLKERRVSKNQCQRDHGDRRYPGDDVEGHRVDIFAHQLAPVYKQQNENHHDWKPYSVAHLRKNQYLPKRRVRQKHAPRPHHDQNRIEPVENGGFFKFMVKPRLKAKPFANHMRGGKGQNGRGEERRVEQPKSK